MRCTSSGFTPACSPEGGLRLVSLSRLGYFFFSSSFTFSLVQTNVRHNGSTSKANDMTMKAAVRNIPHLEPRDGELDKSGSHSN